MEECGRKRGPALCARRSFAPALIIGAVSRNDVDNGTFRQAGVAWAVWAARRMFVVGATSGEGLGLEVGALHALCV